MLPPDIQMSCCYLAMLLANTWNYFTIFLSRLTFSENRCSPPIFPNSHSIGQDVDKDTRRDIYCDTGYQLDNGDTSFSVVCDGREWQTVGDHDTCLGILQYNVKTPTVHVNPTYSRYQLGWDNNWFRLQMVIRGHRSDIAASNTSQ